MVRINLGAGSQRAPGWIEYDRSRVPVLMRNPVTRRLIGDRFGVWPATTRVHDVTRGIPHADASVDVIYSSHMLEHLNRRDGERLLAECARVLRPGGLLRIIVPDFHAVATAYVNADREVFPGKGPIGDQWARKLFPGSRKPDPLVKRTFKRVLRVDDGGHKWMYDEETLRLRLEQAGFEDIQRVEFRQGRDPEAAALDIRSAFHLHMEAVRR